MLLNTSVCVGPACANVVMSSNNVPAESRAIRPSLVGQTFLHLVGQTFLSVPSPRAGDVLIPPSGLGEVILFSNFIPPPSFDPSTTPPHPSTPPRHISSPARCHRSWPAVRPH